MKPNQDQVYSAVRSIAKIAGGILTAHGAVGAATALNTPDAIEAITGVVMAGIALYCSHQAHATPPASNATTIPPTV